MKVVRWVLAAIGALTLVVVLWNQSQRIVNGQAEEWVAYGLVALLVFGDAVFPILPGETTLNAASILAANGELNIWIVILAGAFGAITGDSTVYWIARKAKGPLRAWMDKTAGKSSATRVLKLLHDHGPVFLLFGRYVPGVRFALNATLGAVVKMPYGTFVRWSALSGSLWAAFTCANAYFIGTALAGYPLLSLVVTGLISTVLIAVVIWSQNKFGSHRTHQEHSSTGGQMYTDRRP
jgi:membrane-associated protein